MKISCFIIIFFLFCSHTFAYEIGRCITDPNADKLQKEWKHYFDVKKKRAKINLSKMVGQILMDSETMRLLQSISEVEELMKVLDKLEAKYLKKAFVDKRFNEMISSVDFIDRLESKKMDEEIRNSELPFKNDPGFYELLDQVREEVKRPQIKDALELFRTYDLGVLESEYRKSAKQALRLIRKKGATLEIVRSWIQDPPYLRNVPLPGEKVGPFAMVYRSLLKKSIANFVLNSEVKLAEAKKLYPNIKQAEVDEMNSLTPPTETNSFDDHIFNGSDMENSAIDGVARTLWGEATSCEAQGLMQFEAIGKIIADRAIAVCRAINEQQELEIKNVEVREKNWTTFLSNWAGIKRPAPGMQNKKTPKLKGLSDFGRKEKKDIPCAAQVISKKNQFSVWNSYSVIKLHTGQFNKNIPDTTYELQGPQSSNDDRALVRILCPQFQNDAQKELWSKTVKIATEIVKNADAFSARIKFDYKGNLPILFYTHDAALPFAKEVKKFEMLIEGQKQIIRGKGRDACHKFRLFTPKNSDSY